MTIQKNRGVKRTEEERAAPAGEMVFKGKKAVVLAHGESGHAHAFYGDDTVTLDPKTMQLTVKEIDDLAHEEHAAHTICPGIGEVVIQREYQQGSLKRVQD